MTKPARKSSLTSLIKKKEEASDNQPVANKRKVVNVGPIGAKTTGKPPRSLRLTEQDETELSEWLLDLSNARGKEVSAAKLFRALINMRDKINTAKLVESIKDIG